jgi:4-hydroxybenzoate polyprenyltransferase
MKDTTSHTVPFEHLQVLLRETEKRLAEWILIQHALGAPSTHVQVKDFAQRLARQYGHVSDLGKRWVRHFMARNPPVRTQRAKKSNSVRLNGATATTITAWFKYLADLSISLIKPENRWNKDKTSILEGQGSNGLIIRSSEMKALIKKQSGSRNWTTFVEYISVTGVALPSLVIMKGKTVQQQH